MKERLNQIKHEIRLMNREIREIERRRPGGSGRKGIQLMQPL